MLRITIVLLGIVCATVLCDPVSKCQDLDSQACQLFQKAKPDLCSDDAFALGSCVRFCGNCPLECYSCPYPVYDRSDCSSTMACGANMTCTTKHLRAIDGHHEYIMSCESKQVCDGLTFGFGKRDVDEIDTIEPGDKSRYERDVSVTCCDTDFCNYPFLTTSTSTTTLDPLSVCNRDIVFVLDDSGSVGTVNFQQALSFVRQIVSGINVGPNHAQVAAMAFSTHVQIEWYLNTHPTKSQVLNAISKIKYQSGVTRTGDALEAVRTQMLTNFRGDRPNAENVVIVLTDGQSNDKSDTIHEANQLHYVSRDVISIVVGTGIDMNELNAIATDSHHVFDVRTYSNLNSLIPQLLTLICA